MIKRHGKSLLLLALALIGANYVLTYDKSRAVATSEGKSIVRVLRPDKKSGGTGFVAESPTSGGRYVVTNNHVCGVAVDGHVVLDSPEMARDMRARVIERNAAEDLCLIEAPAGLEPLKLANRPAGLLDRVYVAGHPRLMPLTVTTGLIRQMPKMWEIGIGEVGPDEECEDGAKEVSFIFIKVCFRSFYAYEMTAPILPGNSGSPVLNSDGEVVAVVFAGGDSVSLAIPAQALRNFLSVR